MDINKLKKYGISPASINQDRTAGLSQRTANQNRGQQKFSRTPPNGIVWIRIPQFKLIEQLFQDNKLVLPRSYRPGMYLNMII